LKVSDLIDALKEYPSDMRIMLYDERNEFYFDPVLKKLDVIAAIEWGSEKICRPDKKWHFSEYKPTSILTFQ
jgi:hypothetical protein